MSDTDAHLRRLTGRAWDGLERAVEGFEAAWERGERPDPAAYLPDGATLRRAAVLELAVADLEYRLRAGETARADDYFQRYPELTTDPAAATELVAAEVRGRRNRGEAVDDREISDRFPGHAGAVADRLAASAADTTALAGTASPPDAVPGYTVLDELGRGGMGVVYRARQDGLGRIVALKMARAGGAADAEVFARFRAEAEAVARLQHPHIVQVFEVGTCGGRPYFSMEFVDDGSLQDRLAAGPLAPLAAAELLEPLARAVQYAHERGVLHRDIKPANVLLASAAGGLVPKVNDFGLAKRLDRETANTRTGAVLGTPSYMAPEQAAGTAVGPAADVYALGAVLYATLTGRPPFQAATALDTLDHVRSRDPVAPRLLQPGVPRDLETVCLKCLAKDPPKRYATAAELAEDLARARAGVPVRARRATRTERVWRWCRRNPVVAGLAAALAVLVPAALVTVSVLYWQEERQRKMAEAEALRAAAAADRADEKSDLARTTVDQMLTALGSKLSGTTDIPRVRKEMYERALGLYQRFAAEPGGNSPAVRLGLAKMYSRLGRIDRDMGRFSEARAELGRADTLITTLAAERPDDPAVEREVAYTSEALAGLLRTTGDKPGAVAAYRRVADIERGAPRGTPIDLAAQDRYTNALSNMAVALRDNGQPAEAIAALRECVAQSRQRLSALPADFGLRAGLAIRLTNLGILLDESGQLDDAAAACRESEEVYAALVVAVPAAVDYREALANSANNYGVVLRHQDRPKESADALRRSRDVRAGLVRDFPDLPAFRLQLAQAHSNLASILTAAGRPADAPAEVAAAINLLERLVADFPTAADYRTQLASTYENRAAIALGTNRPADALADYARAIALLEERGDVLLKATANRKLLGTAYRSRGLSLAALNRHAEAVVQFDRALPFLPAERCITQVYRARSLAKSGDSAAAAAAADELARTPGLTGEQTGMVAEVYAMISVQARDDKARAEAYAAQAVAMVRTAIARGLSRDVVANDDELAPLRDRPDFRACLDTAPATAP